MDERLNITRVECAKLLYHLFDDRCKRCGDCCKGGNGIGGKMPSCISQKGFFKDETKFEEMKTRYNWTDAKGFVGDNGCEIPVEERAVTCLEWGCPATMKKFTHEDINLLNLLRLRIMLLERSV